LGRSFGDYELASRMGEGSSSIVYRARYIPLNKPIALKLVRSGQFASDEERNRFQMEAKAAANLDHPNIIPVFEVGEHEGWPFLAMKLVEGGSLADRLRKPRGTAPEETQGKAMPQREAVRLLTTIASAVHYAHQRGLLHRDLKPSNILLEANGEPQLTDFGIAKWLEGSGNSTRSQALLGTPAYMSPEQAAGRTRDVAVTSDIYSLGVILYELLCGRPPFVAESDAALLQQVIHREPAPPHLLNSELDADLDTICLKCLQKEPAQRYPSAEALADDLERWLGHEPILARPTGHVERARKWMRRNPTVAALTVLLLLSLIGGLISTSWHLARADRLLAESSARNARLRENMAWREQRDIGDLYSSHLAHEGLKTLVRLVKENPSNTVAAARLYSSLTQLNWPWPLLPPLHHEAEVLSGAVTPNGQILLTASADGLLHAWEARSGSNLFNRPHDSNRGRFALSPDGSRVATLTKEGFIQMWCTTNGLAIFDRLGDASGITALAFLPKSQFLATASTNGQASLWRMSDGHLERQLSHGEPIHFLRVHPRGQFLLTLGQTDGRLWPMKVEQAFLPAVPKTETEQPITFFTLASSFLPSAPPTAAEFSPDGLHLVTIENGQIHLRDAATGANIRVHPLDGESPNRQLRRW